MRWCHNITGVATLLVSGGNLDAQEATNGYPGCFPSKFASVRMEGNGLKRVNIEGKCDHRAALAKTIDDCMGVHALGGVRTG